jgi:hypothetical protein
MKWYSILRGGVIFSLVAVLFGSVSHLSYTFNTIEKEGYAFVGLVIALGIEAMLAFTAFALKENRKRVKNKKNQKEIESESKRLMWYIAFFSLINFFGNYYYAAAGHLSKNSFLWSDFASIDPMNHIKFFLLAASLPGIALSGIEIFTIVSKVFDKASKIKRKPAKRIEKKIEKKKIVHPLEAETGVSRNF